MEEMMRKRCEEHNVSFDTLTDSERAILREEIEADQHGRLVMDSVLDDIEIRIRKFE